MATAEQLRAEFENALGQQGIAFQIVDVKDNVLKVHLNLNDEDALPIFVDFLENEDESYVVKLISRFGRCSQDAFSEVLLKVNSYNQALNFVKFYIDFDNNGYGYLYASIDAFIFPGSAGAECLIALRLLVQDLARVLGDLGNYIQVTVERIETKEETDEPSEAELRAMLEAIQRKLGEK